LDDLRKNQVKQLSSFKIGKVNARKEARRLRRIQQNQERIVFRKLNTLFRKFLRTSAFLYEEFGQFNISVSSFRLREELTPTLINHYKRVFRTIYNSNNEMFDRGRKQEEIFVFDRSQDFEKLIDDYFRNRQLYLVGITTRIANRIDKIIQNGRAEGLTLREIARNIANDFGFTRSRASLIARTETHSAATFANHQYYRTAGNDYGFNFVKQWVATNDERTRPDHRNANGQVVDMDEDFNIGGVLMEYAGDPKGGAKNVVNCRCVIVYKDKDDL